MTITLYRKVYPAPQEGKFIFFERYSHKFCQPCWRYGIILNGIAYVHKDGLKTKPNIKRLLQRL